MPDDNVATIRRLYDALEARDASVIQEVFAPAPRSGRALSFRGAATTKAVTACSRSS
jgi:hypothetical protein